MSKPIISIIVPAYKRDEKIIDLLDSLENQNYPKNKFELIIIDNSPVKSIIKNIIEKLKKLYAFDILYIYENKRGISKSRNIGIRKAKGDYILLFAQDVFPISKNFLNEHMKIHKKYKDAACLGYITWHPKIEKNNFNEFLKNKLFSFNKIKDKENCSFWFFFGTNISLEKKWFKDDLFDERLVYGYEDSEIGYRLSNKGLKIVFNPKASVYHNHEYKLDSYLRRQYMVSRALKTAKNIQNIFIYPFYKKVFMGIILSPLAMITRKISINSRITWKLLVKYIELKGILDTNYNYEKNMKNMYSKE